MSKLLSFYHRLAGLRGWIVLFLCFDIAFVLLLLIRPAGVDLGAATDVLGSLGSLLAVFLCARQLWRQRTLVTLFLGLGLLAYTMGQITWSYYEIIVHQSPFPSWADVGYLLSSPLLLIAVLLMPARQIRGVSRMRMLLDGTMIMTAVITFSWYFVLGPTILEGSDSLLAKVIGGAYPAFDLLQLLCVLLLWMRNDDRRMRLALSMLSLGLLTVVLADSSFAYLSLHDSYVSGSLIDTLWPIGYQWVALGAAVLLPASEAATTVSAPNASTLWRSLLPYLFLPALGILIVYTWRTRGDEALQPAVYLGTVILIGLIVLRQILAMREMHYLYTNNSALVVANEQLEIQATHDNLTGLPNRNLLWKRLAQVIQQIHKDHQHAVLLLLDLDRFKEVNDTLGHQAGDELLQCIGPRLQGSLRKGDLLVRLGGDEFAVVLPRADATLAVQIAKRLLDALASPFQVDGHALDIGGSIGIVLTSEENLDAMTLLRCADVAMYVAKRTQSGYVIYTPEIDEHSPYKLTLMSELRRAIANNELVLYYQPKIAHEKLMGVEALVRWSHPVRGLVPPDEFISLAEQTGLIGALTRWVLEQALRQGMLWEQAGLGINIAVNISTRTLYDGEFIPLVTDLLETYRVVPGRLTLEITESTLMDDPQRAQGAIEQLRMLGIRVALDDFGTGYSSLGYLKRLALDEIKIDKSFVLDLGTQPDPSDLAIVKAVVSIANPLRCKVVAEGVEDAETWSLLQRLGCDLAQGYYFSRPLPPTELEQWIQRTPWKEYEQGGLAVA